VTVADLNHDGIPDLAIANFTGQGTVSILLGNGDGTFQSAQSYAAGIFPSSVAVGDFNGDGIPDLALAAGYPNCPGSSSVQVLLGNGDGTFQAATQYSAGDTPSCVAVRDLNGDGIADLAVTNFVSNDVSVLLGHGDGTFQAAVNYAVGPSAAPPLSLAVADFNRDGFPDLAVTFAGGVRLLLGNGDGTFQPTPLSYVAGSYFSALAVGDFNRDGFSDLVVTNPDGNIVSILINDKK
jgi:hypothetical protein